MTTQTQPRTRYRRLSWQRFTDAPGVEYLAHTSGANPGEGRTYLICEDGLDWILWRSGVVEGRGTLREMFRLADNLAK